MEEPPSSPPPPHSVRDPLLHRQDWELLSASALLTQSHILGLGLGLGRGDADRDGSSESSSRHSGGELNPPLLSLSAGYGRISAPADISQISAMYASSTAAGGSALEPFTEGWEPQFRIAGAPLQEDYYGREDPFVVLDQRPRHQSEPFLVMEQVDPDSIGGSKEEEGEQGPSLRVSSKERTTRERNRFVVERAKDEEEEEEEEDDEDEDEDENEDDDDEEEEDDDEDGAKNRKECALRVVKSTKRKVSSLFSEKISRWNLEKHMYQRSHIILSVAIAAALLGAFLYRRSSTSRRSDC